MIWHRLQMRLASVVARQPVFSPRIHTHKYKTIIYAMCHHLIWSLWAVTRLFPMLHLFVLPHS